MTGWSGRRMKGIEEVQCARPAAVTREEAANVDR